MNYMKATIEENQLMVTMYIDDKPSSWIMFDEAQAENMIKVLKKELKCLKKVNKKACASKNPDNMCDSCNCWKQTRAYCS